MADVDEAMDLVAAITELLEGKRYRVVVSALGIILTELAAAHDPQERENFLRVLLDGVRQDVSLAAKMGRMVLTKGAIVWH